MSWKRCFCAGIVCALMAAPAMAQPALSVVNVGLNSAGDWVWEVRADPDESLFTDFQDEPDRGVGGSVDVEIGFAETAGTGADLLSVEKDGTNFPNDNPGMSPFSFGNPPDLGITIGTGANDDSFFAALGSRFFEDGETDGTSPMLLTITILGPSTGVGGSLTTTLETSGVYEASGTTGIVNTGGSQGLIGQDGMEFVTNTVYSRSAFPGDVGLDDFVSSADAAILGLNWLMSVSTKWRAADFNNDGMVSSADAALVGLNWLMGPGSGSGSGGGLANVGVPEPSSLLLVLLGVVFARFLVRRE